MRVATVLLAVSVVLVACSGSVDNSSTTDPQRAEGPAVERRRLPDTPAPPATPVAPQGVPTPTLPPIEVPAGSLYVCVVDSGGVRKQTAIEFAPKVGALCAKAPEMGPCQYERNACRRSGGRVYAANGVEITMQTEAEYDKKVLRARFNGG